MSRWLRIDTTWSSSAWVAELPPESRLCWIELLCYAKAHGIAGRVKALSPQVASRTWGVTPSNALLMLEAAEAHGALTVEVGEWVLSTWRKYQGDETSADRQKRYRASRSRLSTSRVTPVTDRDVTDVTPTVTVTETERKNPRKKRHRATALPDAWKPRESHRERAEKEGVDLTREAEKFRHHAAANGRLQLDWDQAFFTWLMRAADYGAGRGNGKPKDDRGPGFWADPEDMKPGGIYYRGGDDA
jgi:hypothetical protein